MQLLAEQYALLNLCKAQRKPVGGSVASKVERHEQRARGHHKRPIAESEARESLELRVVFRCLRPRKLTKSRVCSQRWIQWAFGASAIAASRDDSCLPPKCKHFFVVRHVALARGSFLDRRYPVPIRSAIRVLETCHCLLLPLLQFFARGHR